MDPSLEEAVERLQGVVSRSTADALRITWIETLHGEAAGRGPQHRTGDPDRRLTVLVRAAQGSRWGVFRTASGDARALDGAVRQAVAVSRIDPPSDAPAPLVDSPVGSAAAPPESLFDPEVAALDPGSARDRLRSLTGPEERARLRWCQGRAVVVDSGGSALKAEATAVELSVRAGRGPGAGRARGAARRLEDVDGEEVCERARQRRVEETVGDAPSSPGGLVLAPEAAACLLELLSRAALSSRAFLEGSPALKERLGERVAPPLVHLRDDGTDPAGLPFPFDLEGRAKGPVPLIEEGVLRTPAVNGTLAAELGLSPTPHYLAPDESEATHLFLKPGETSQQEVLAAVEDGLWIGSLRRLACHDPGSLAFRARAGGVRSIVGGRLGPPLPDWTWDDRLDRVLGAVVAVGGRPVLRRTADGLLGAISAPAVAVGPPLSSPPA